LRLWEVRLRYGCRDGVSIVAPCPHMYSVDNRDSVVSLDGVPQSSIGAPCPFVMSDEHTLMLAYIIEKVDPNWDGTYVRSVGPNTAGETVALVRFTRYSSFMFGPPNDEAFGGHPLASRGLKPYSAVEVRHSSWIRRLERMNAVHPRHTPALFDGYRHFIFAFHDSTFECVAEDFTIAVHERTMASLLPEMGKLLNWSA
jgi:hypothetical protein